MIVGGYDLHLYCDTRNRQPDTQRRAPEVEVHGYLNGGSNEFCGRNEREAMRAAREAGWTFKRGGFVYCPDCSRATLNTGSKHG